MQGPVIGNIIQLVRRRISLLFWILIILERNYTFVCPKQYSFCYLLFLWWNVREGNVFNRFRISMILFTLDIPVQVPSPRPPYSHPPLPQGPGSESPDVQGSNPPPTCSNMFTMKHRLSAMALQAIGMRLKCLLFDKVDSLSKFWTVLNIKNRKFHRYNMSRFPDHDINEKLLSIRSILYRGEQRGRSHVNYKLD